MAYTTDTAQTAISGHAFQLNLKTIYGNGKHGLNIASLAEVISSISYKLNPHHLIYINYETTF